MPIRHERHLRGIGPDFSEIASEAERAKIERREQWRADADAERKRERDLERERRPEPELPRGWFGQ